LKVLKFSGFCGIKEEKSDESSYDSEENNPSIDFLIFF